MSDLTSLLYCLNDYYCERFYLVPGDHARSCCPCLAWSSRCLLFFGGVYLLARATICGDDDCFHNGKTCVAVGTHGHGIWAVHLGNEVSFYRTDDPRLAMLAAAGIVDGSVCHLGYCTPDTENTLVTGCLL